ncbi:MAG TPA: hypothetical protein VJ890_03950, partial [Vineibacter sp.]|nr:hypothetical protein [Vineibacter sp.]
MAKVTVVEPERKTLRRMVEQPAQIEAFETTPLYANAAGYVRAVEVDMGDKIQGPHYDAKGKLTKPGEPLVELALPEAEDEVRQKQALVAQRKAEVVQAEAGVRMGEAGVTTAQAKSALAAAAAKRTAASYEKWKSELGRVVELSEKSVLNAKVVDETRNQLAAADAAREETTAEIESAQAAVAESHANLEKARADLTAARSRVGVAEADRDRSQALLDYGTIRAPFDGVITSRDVHTG